MKNSTLGKFLALVLLLAGAAASLGASKHSYQPGKLINVSTDERFVEGTSIRYAMFTIQIGDLIYTAKGDRVRRNSGDIASGLIFGDPVQVFVDRDDLFLQKPDGKEMKLKILKRERNPAPSS